MKSRLYYIQNYLIVQYNKDCGKIITIISEHTNSIITSKGGVYRLYKIDC